MGINSNKEYKVLVGQSQQIVSERYSILEKQGWELDVDNEVGIEICDKDCYAIPLVRDATNKPDVDDVLMAEFVEWVNQ